MLARSHSILNRWNDCFSQLLNVHNVNDVRQTEVHTAEPLVPGPSCLEVETAIAKLKKYKSPGSDQIPAFTHRNRPPDSLLTLNGRNIPFVNSVKYLGVIFDKRMTWRLHIL
jgi:hypothetical protein